MPALAAIAFGLSWWLGLYLLARNLRKPLLRRAGAGLIAYALVVAAEPVVVIAPDLPLDLPRTVLLCVPALAWAGAALRLLPDDLPRRAIIDRTWMISSLTLLVAVPVLPAPARLVVLIPLAAALLLLVRQARRGPATALTGPLLAGALFFGLGLAALLLPLDGLPRPLILGAIGLDLAILGAAVASHDAFSEGERLRPDMRRSFVASAVSAVLFGGQVGAAILLSGPSPALVGLMHGTVATAVTVVVFAGPAAALLDRMVFPGARQLRRERAELRDAAEALPRRPEQVELAAVDEAGFVRFVRRALRDYGDLGRLVGSPLTWLPAIDKRLAARGAPLDQPLERAAELKALLRESIERLRPREGTFGTTDEWRHYNCLHYYYVVGIRPHGLRSHPDGLGPDARQAFEWFRRYVPERTLHNWQTAATKVVAADIRRGLSEN